jgi:hypothetical protein
LHAYCIGHPYGKYFKKLFIHCLTVTVPGYIQSGRIEEDIDYFLQIYIRVLRNVGEVEETV